MEAYDSIKCGCFWIDLMLKGKSLLDYTNLFSLRESTVLLVENIKTLKTLRYHMF